MVINSDGALRGQDILVFNDWGDFRLAEPSALYMAGTGGIGYDLNKKYDYGYFYVTNNPWGGTQSDPYGQIKITYRQTAMVNRIDGTTIPPRNSTATWSAQVSGGVPPYSFYWYRDDVLVGTSQFYTGTTGTANFGLRVAVVDQTMSERVDVMPVDVGGALVSITGPDVAYLVHDDPMGSSATWTAAVQGGTPPFTYLWRREGFPTGTNSPSHTEYIDERQDFTLRVEITDATGKSAIHQKFVRVGERDCATCPPY